MKKNQHFPKLFERGYIAGLEIKNRIVRQPMGTELGNPDGACPSPAIPTSARCPSWPRR